MPYQQWTNKQLKEPTDISEFLRFVGCWFYMAFLEGIPSQYSWWSSTTIYMFHGSHFRLNEYINCNRFDDILGALRYTSEEVQYADPFLEMIHMEELWNKNMEEKFNPGWINFMGKL